VIDEQGHGRILSCRYTLHEENVFFNQVPFLLLGGLED
jgi:hypothetical protein